MILFFFIILCNFWKLRFFNRYKNRERKINEKGEIFINLKLRRWIDGDNDYAKMQGFVSMIQDGVRRIINRRSRSVVPLGRLGTITDIITVDRDADEFRSKVQSYCACAHSIINVILLRRKKRRTGNG